MLENLQISLNLCTNAIVGIPRATLHELELHVIQMLFVLIIVEGHFSTSTLDSNNQDLWAQQEYWHTAR